MYIVFSVESEEGVEDVRMQRVRALEGLALQPPMHSSEVAQLGSCCMRPSLAAVPVLFLHAAITVAKKLFTCHP